VSILDSEVAKIWVKVGKKEGIRDVSWDIVGEDVVEEDVESANEQDRRRDLNLRKLMTLDLDDCNTTNDSEINVQPNI
jgi:hypothetical protein